MRTPFQPKLTQTEWAFVILVIALVATYRAVFAH